MEDLSSMGFDNRDNALGVLRSFIVNEVPSKIEATARDIAEYAIEKATELSPFDTGQFMASWRVGLSEDAATNPDNFVKGRRSSEYEAATESVDGSRAAIASVRFGQTFYVGNAAPYAVFVEYGSAQVPAHMITQRVAQSIGAVYGRISLGGSTRHRFTWGRFNDVTGFEPEG